MIIVPALILEMIQLLDNTKSTKQQNSSAHKHKNW